MGTIRSKTGVRELMKDYRAEHASATRLAFMLQDWEDAYNVGGMFRVADGCGAQEMVMTGRTPVLPNPMIGVTSLGHHRRIPYRHIERHDEAALRLKAEGWTLVAVEIAEGAKSYLEYEYPEKTCLVLGNEANGVYGNVSRLCDGAVYIPMMGKGRSLNVHVAAAIVGFHVRLRG